MNEQSRDILEDLCQSKQMMMEQLNKSDIVDIFGVVDASGPGGFRLQGEEFWTLLFSFDAWRFSSGNLRYDKLTLRKLVTEIELEIMKESINPFDVLHVRAGVTENSVFEGAQGILFELVDSISSSRELNSHAEELRKPVAFYDSTFGLFVLDRSLNWFQSSTKWNSEEILLNLSMDYCEDEKKVLEIASSFWSAKESWSKRIYDYVLANLFNRTDGLWLDGGVDMLTPDLFKRRMKVETITLYPDSSFEFWYKDSEQFLRQPIIVYGNLHDGPIEVDIPNHKLFSKRNVNFNNGKKKIST